MGSPPLAACAVISCHRSRESQIANRRLTPKLAEFAPPMHTTIGGAPSTRNTPLASQLATHHSRRPIEPIASRWTRLPAVPRGPRAGSPCARSPRRPRLKNMDRRIRRAAREPPLGGKQKPQRRSSPGLERNYASCVFIIPKTPRRHLRLRSHERARRTQRRAADNR